MNDTQAKMEILLRARPRPAPGCCLERQQLAVAAPVYILKDEASRVYMRLTEEGEFLWRQIDGARTIRELCVAYGVRFQRRAPDEVLCALARMLEASFIRIESGEDGMRSAPTSPSNGTLTRLASYCTWYAELPDVDAWVTALYRLLRPLYTRSAQAVLLLVTGVGAAAFAWHCAQGAVGGGLSRSTFVWIAGLALQVLVHEAAHAMTCKHFGRAVHRVGVGWYYFAPVAFVDTSDMWAAARWPRVLVSAAGPYANLALAGLATLVALLPGTEAVREAMWSLSATGYVLAAVNMNPLLELDGYYVLMDALESPNLRARALAALGSLLHGRVRAQTRGDRLVLLFGAASLVYTVVMAFAVLFASRAWIGDLAAAWLPRSGAHAIGWALAVAMCALILVRVAESLRPKRRGR